MTNKTLGTVLLAACWLLGSGTPGQAKEAAVTQWSGMAHFRAKTTQQGQTAEDPTAAVDTEIAFTIDAQGNLHGRTTTNGCSLSGLARPARNDRYVEVRAELSGCMHAGFNRRFSGTLIFGPQRRSAELSLTATGSSGVAGETARYQITSEVKFN